MVVSLVLGFLAMFVATMGMKCTSCGGDDKAKKARIAMTGGIVFIVAGEPLGSKVVPRAHFSIQKCIAKILVWTPNTRTLFLFLGLAALVACSWIGHQIVTDFYNPLTPMNVK